MTLKRVILFLGVFTPVFLFSIYPTFTSFSGVDCLAGCAVADGFPFPYRITHLGGIADFSATTEISYQALLIDIVFVFISSLAISYGLSRVFFRNQTD